MALYSRCLIVLVLGAALLSSAASGEDLVVPTDYATIQEAIFLAREGDRIVVESGVYAEDLLIDGRRGLTLLGLGAPRVESQERHALKIHESQDIRVSGFQFRGESGFLVFIEKSTGVVIRNSSIGSAYSSGVRLRQASNVKLSKLRIFETAGACLDIGMTSTDVLLQNSELFDCSTSVFGPAVGAEAGDDLVVKNNRFGRCTWHCIEFKRRSRGSILKNELEGGRGAGILVHKGHRVIANRVGRTRRAGIEVTGADNVLKRNVVKPKRCGLDMDRDRNTLEDNDFGTKCRNGTVRGVD